MIMPLQPLEFIIENLLFKGLHILAGSPKVGKSWLALWLAITVSKGEEIWSNKVKQGTTL
ncbi:MAG: AAA family ATPase [Alkaliphilus sp.]|nr:AAA family ATPase [Alkaliphilus sp.]